LVIRSSWPEIVVAGEIPQAAERPKFGAGEAARAAGLLHDIGEDSDVLQARIRN
jgi:hypothetical protein